MRILFFLEPVIFRQTPLLITAHLTWLLYVKRGLAASGGEVALAANPQVCEKWREMNGDEAVQCFPLDAFQPLLPFHGKRTQYMKALYGDGKLPNALSDGLKAIRDAFSPDLLIMTTQNAFVQHVFTRCPILHWEFTPMPRSHYISRLGMDPCGHQVNTMIETYAERIKTFPLTLNERAGMSALLESIKQGLPFINALHDIKQKGKVALLVTQPPDWMTYEGAYDAVEIDTLVHAWATALPEGWVGVPTYHPAYRPSAEMEKALASACPRLHFLPNHLSLGMSEALLLEADGLVTISSSVAMTGLLFQKKVVVTGRSPYNTWCQRDPSQLERAVPLTLDEALSTLAFLCHRYSYPETLLTHQPDILMPLFHAMTTMTAPAEWFLDKADWSLARVYGLFEIQISEPKKSFFRRVADYVKRRFKKLFLD